MQARQQEEHFVCAGLAGTNTTMLLAGTIEKLVPYEQFIEFGDAIRAKMGDNKVTFIPVEGAGHDDPKFGTDENVKLIFDFIDSHLSKKVQSR